MTAKSREKRTEAEGQIPIPEAVNQDPALFNAIADPKFLRFDGTWGFKDFFELGHLPQKIYFGKIQLWTNCNKGKKKGKNTEDTQRGPVRKEKRERYTKRIAVLSITQDKVETLSPSALNLIPNPEKLTDMFLKHYEEKINERLPNKGSIQSSHIMPIEKILTLNIEEDITCLWVNKSVGAPGQSSRKLLLKEINGQRNTDFSISQQINAAGDMFWNRCDTILQIVSRPVCSELVKK